MSASPFLIAAFLTSSYAAPQVSESVPSEWSAFGKERGIQVKVQYVPTESVKTWNVKSKPITKQTMKLATKFWPFFKSEFEKYPLEFLQKSGLKEIDLVTDLSVNGSPVKAMPDYVNERLVLDVTMADDEWYSRHVTHHEYYHLVEDQHFGSPYYKDPNWAKFNPPSFKYGKGGAYARDPKVTPFTHPQAGFINLYSQSGLEEDKAEVWAVIMYAGNWKVVSPWLKTDSRLKNKTQYMMDFAERVSPKMDKDYWKKVQGR